MRISIVLFLGMLFMADNNLTAQHERTEHWYMRTMIFKKELNTVPKGSVIFLGNSITEGFDLSYFFPDSKPINRGINGDHIDGLLDRLEISVIKLQPSQLFILIGINDIGAGDSDSTILTNYSTLLRRLAHKLTETDIFVHSILPAGQEWSNCPKEKIVRVNKNIETFVKKYGFEWIDLYPYFVNSEGYLKRDYTSDGLHLNAKGYKKWQNILNKAGLK
jgi:lysophospholipase L1-like esterase